MEKKIVMTPDEFRRWQRSAETKEHNEALKQEIKDKQESVISVIREMPIDSGTAGRLFSYGFTSVRGLTVGDVLDRAESEDIREALHEAGAGYRHIRESDVDAVKEGLSKGADIEEIITVVAEQASERIVRARHR